MEHMNRTHGLSLLLGLALFIAVTHTLAYEHAWYWQYWWLDIVMHFSVGVFVAGAVLISGAIRKPLKVAGVSLLIGSAWEVFEFITKISYSRSYVFDTSLDLLMDIVGALALCAIVAWWNKK